MPMMAITTRSSTNVKAAVGRPSRGRLWSNRQISDRPGLARLARPTWAKCPTGRNLREDQVMRRRASPKAEKTRWKQPLSPLLARAEAWRGV